MKKTPLKLVFLVLTLIVVGGYFTYYTMEGFFFGATSPGTMVQLKSTHVLTQEDLDEEVANAKQVQEEIQRMTT